jgi:NADPH-dependent curcumin reductase CurA
VRSRAFRLRRRPDGQPGEGDLELVEAAVPAPGPGEALVRTLLLSPDPANRIWMSDMRGYQPPVPVGAVMDGIGLGRVVASRRPDLPEGALVTGRLGWQEHALVPAGKRLRVLPDPLPAPPPAFLGVLGHTGLTAYVGLEIGRPQPGETLVVSAAAGAVGSVAGQLARERGARVVGIAGGEAKCRHVVETLGFHACVDRTAADWRERLDAAVPDGVDVDFENAGGELMDHVLLRLNLGARVVLCGMISQYDAAGAQREWRGQVNIGQILMQRATMRGFIVSDHPELVEPATAEIARLLREGRLHHDETILDGFERMPEALGRLFAGASLGKLLVRVADG